MHRNLFVKGTLWCGFLLTLSWRLHGWLLTAEIYNLWLNDTQSETLDLKSKIQRWGVESTLRDRRPARLLPRRPMIASWNLPQWWNMGEVACRSALGLLYLNRCPLHLNAMTRRRRAQSDRRITFAHVLKYVSCISQSSPCSHTHFEHRIYHWRRACRVIQILDSAASFKVPPTLAFHWSRLSNSLVFH